MCFRGGRRDWEVLVPCDSKMGLDFDRGGGEPLTTKVDLAVTGKRRVILFLNEKLCPGGLTSG